MPWVSASLGRHEDMANARLRFANGAVADVTASRVHPSAYRQMHLWGPEGYAGLDFAQRRVNLIQPSATSASGRARSGQARSRHPRARIKDDLFGRHLESYTIDGKSQDQLTCEFKEFVSCVQSGSKPRADGMRAETPSPWQIEFWPAFAIMSGLEKGTDRPGPFKFRNRRAHYFCLKPRRKWRKCLQGRTHSRRFAAAIPSLTLPALTQYP